MMKISVLSLAAILMSVSALAVEAKAKDVKKPAEAACAYCAELDTLKAEFAKLKPDSLDEATIDKQLDLVDKTSELVKKILSANKKSPAKPDLERAIKIMAVAAPFDAQHLIAENAVSVLGKKVDSFYAEINKMEKSAALSKPEAERLKVALAVSEDEKTGQDPAASKGGKTPAAAKKK